MTRRPNHLANIGMSSASQPFDLWLRARRKAGQYSMRVHNEDLFSPVFNIEILYATELVGVVSHERELE
jgi:hypothetical protein